MADCTKKSGDWDRLEALAKTLSSPKSFAYHVGKDLLINGKDIFGEIATGIQDYDDRKWEAFGEQIGMAAAKTILGEENATCRDNRDATGCNLAGCSWCTSFAVKAACNSIEDAEKLPPTIFVCNNLPAHELFLN